MAKKILFSVLIAGIVFAALAIVFVLNMVTIGMGSR